MRIRLFAAPLAALAVAAPAQAQELWSHEASGVSIPRTIGDMRVGRERDGSGTGHDMIVQLGSRDTPVTLYVYRSAYPNAALWFERTRLAMNMNVRSPEQGVAPRTITIGGASAPNGLREDIAIPGGRYRATSVAMVQAGEWLVKARVSSTRLDLAGVSARMDQLLGALRFANMPAPHPLRVPTACTEANAMSGRPVTDLNEELLAAALPTVVAGETAARGQGGLAANPSAWCRDTTQVPVGYATVYRARDGSGWVSLLSDSGRAISAMRNETPGPAGAALLAATPSATSLVAIFADLPHPEAGTVAAIPVAVGQAQGLVSVGGPPRQSTPKN